MLYRPSPLSPTLSQARVKILLEAATMSIRQATNMHRQQRFAYNWLNLLAIFTSSLSLIYAITAQPNNLVDVLKETEVVHELESAMEILETLGIKFTAAKKIRHMIGEIVERYRELCCNWRLYVLDTPNIDRNLWFWSNRSAISYRSLGVLLVIHLGKRERERER